MKIEIRKIIFCKRPTWADILRVFLSFKFGQNLGPEKPGSAEENNLSKLFSQCSVFRT